jgi:hypothetical protein
MTRTIGRNQRRILDILLEHGEPMTHSEILAALSHSERVSREIRRPNLSQTLAGLARRGLVRLDGGEWLMVDGTRRRVPLTVVAIEPPAPDEED